MVVQGFLLGSSYIESIWRVFSWKSEATPSELSTSNPRSSARSNSSTEGDEGGQDIKPSSSTSQPFRVVSLFVSPTSLVVRLGVNGSSSRPDSCTCEKLFQNCSNP